VKTEYFPAINASLNGLSAILLVTGYGLVRARRYVAHATTMILALVTSAAFLACYLTYHAIRLREHVVVTPFPQGSVRPFYLAILLTHTVLAAAIVPMILITVSFAALRKWRNHLALARWTFPLWLYVSVTGVVIYFMLYHLAPALRN
jgi:uncharacterized membrane protein YozB (DUF420 family)